MTQPVPEETNAALDVSEPPPGEHGSELPDEDDTGHESPAAEENAESSADQPSDSAG